MASNSAITKLDAVASLQTSILGSLRSIQVEPFMFMCGRACPPRLLIVPASAPSIAGRPGIMDMQPAIMRRRRPQAAR
jgi:hypothetical protein